MVVFTCNHCGDSVQKPKVERHYSFVCKTVKSLTCVDCFRDFSGEEYVTHIKCLTEEERYAAKGAFTNGNVKKGEAKQETWVEMVKSILDNDQNLKPSCRKLLNSICNFPNIPRKKPKFINFVKSASGQRANLKDVEEVWNIIEKYKADKGQETQAGNGKENLNDTAEKKDNKNNENEIKKRKTDEDLGDTPKKKKSKSENGNHEVVAENITTDVQDTEDASKKKKKHKVEEETNVGTKSDTPKNEITEENIQFSFQEKILEIVTAKRTISLKKLQKKVLNAYIKTTGETEITPKDVKKFNKKLKKVPNLEINEENVVILQTAS